VLNPNRLALCTGVLALIVSSAAPARAQVSGATGAIIGTVTDNTKATVPGASVTVSSSALMGTRTAVTGSDGAFRIPDLPPGTYTLTFDLEGFGAVKREGIQIGVGFTATVNVEMNVAGVSENVTVSGASPVVDLTSTKVTNNLGAERIQNLTGKADLATILGITPGIAMSKPDVGGSGAISYANGPRYGIQGQDRGEVEGLSTQEQAGGGAELPYTDTHTFEDVAMTVVGNTAEMGQPGTYTQVVVKSGGNTYHGHISETYENKNWQSHNIDASQLAFLTDGPGLKAVDSNRILSFQDFSAQIGGYVVKDKLWWFGGYRREALTSGLGQLVGASIVSSLPVWSGKVTENLDAKNRLIGYYQRGVKHQNPGVAPSQQFELSAGQDEAWPSGLWKTEWDSTLSNALLLQVRGGLFFERGNFIANDHTHLQYLDTGANTLRGSFGDRIYVHNRWQINGNISYFKKNRTGSHNIKIGGEWIHETANNLLTKFGNIEMFLNNGRPTQVQLFQNATANLTALREWAVFVQDSWKPNSRLTVNAGFRFDQYLAYTPSQVAPQGFTFNRINAPVWNGPGPRIGAAYALTDDGKTLVKGSYGLFWEDPYTYSLLQNQFNPNAQTSSTYVWTPANPKIVDGLPVYTPGEEGRLISSTGVRPDGTPAVGIDPNLKDTYSQQATGYFEREIGPNLGVRTGFVWNGWRRAYGTVDLNQPFGAFNVPVTVTDPGRDGRLGTADDGPSIPAFNLAPAYVGLTPNQVVTNLPDFMGDSNYYTWEVTATKRRVGPWSMMSSWFKTWSHETPYGGGLGSAPPYFTPTVFNPNTAINAPAGQNSYTSWGVKLMGTLDVPWRITLSPYLRWQSGQPFARTFNQSLNFNSSVVVKAENLGTERLPAITIFDLRAEKSIRFGGQTVAVLLDLYNLFNTNTIQSATFSSGSGFLRPTTITGPRILGVGLKYDF
jgi:carboxypeptidase family protein